MAFGPCTPLILKDSSDQNINWTRVIKMLLIIDIVEIDAGDPIPSTKHRQSLSRRSRAKAAERIFGLLPTSQGEETQKPLVRVEAPKSRCCLCEIM